jgi:lactate permease
MTAGLLTFAAGAPILLVCGLLAFRVSATVSALASIAAAMVVSLLWFPVDSATAVGTAEALGPLLLEVVLIILGGVLLAEVLTASGAQTTIARWLTDACRGRGRVVLLITLGVTPFAESVTGFGLGVIVSIPLLRHIGLSRVKSAVAALLGLVLVPWGSLAPGTLIAAQLGGVDFAQLGVWSAVFTLPVLLINTPLILLIAVGRTEARRSIADAVAVVAVMWPSLIAANLVLGPPLAGAVASVITIAAVLLIARVVERNRLSVDRTLGRALLPYGVLIVGLLLSSLAARMLDLGGIGRILASPALWLLVTGALAFPLVRVRRDAAPGLLLSSARRGIPVAFTTALFLVLGGLMAASGTSAYLAEAASGLGPVYLVLIPLVGAIGGYITGSNSGASAMFSASTTQSALTLGADPLTALATQNVGASAALMASPPRVALAVSVAAATGGDEPPEAQTAGSASAPVTRVVLLATTAIAIVLGVLALLFA